MATASQAWVDGGQEWAVDAIHDKVDAGSRASGSMNFVAWGSGTTAAAVTQTTLVTEHAETRATGTVSQPAANQYRVVGTITATATRVVEEMGIFNQETVAGSIMWMRATHGQLNLVSGDSVEYTATITLADSSE